MPCPPGRTTTSSSDSAGAALIGIQFVVITLIADIHPQTSEEAINAFGTSTVVHLTGTLVISGAMNVPWWSIGPLCLVLGAYGLGGLTYGIHVIRQSLRQHAYEVVWQDWLWYAVVPAVVYVTLASAALALDERSPSALFVVAAAAMLLLIAGIHNAWDTVTHIVITASNRIGQGDAAGGRQAN